MYTFLLVVLSMLVGGLINYALQGEAAFTPAGFVPVVVVPITFWIFVRLDEIRDRGN